MWTLPALANTGAPADFDEFNDWLKSAGRAADNPYNGAWRHDWRSISAQDMRDSGSQLGRKRGVGSTLACLTLVLTAFTLVTYLG
jgi:hypothetical protein